MGLDKIFYPYYFTFRKDWLSIMDGNGNLVAGPYCGSNSPPDYTSASNVAGVYFRSDSTGNRKGFEIKYTCENESPGRVNPKDPELFGHLNTRGWDGTKTAHFVFELPNGSINWD